MSPSPERLMVVHSNLKYNENIICITTDIDKFIQIKKLIHERNICM